MNVYKVDFEYIETGYIPNVIANSEAEAIEGAQLILKKQGLPFQKIVKATNLSQETLTEDTENKKQEVLN